MVKALNRLSKIRSLDEFLTRGGQAVSAFSEQARGSSIPTDREFEGLLNRGYFHNLQPTDSLLRERFFASGKETFFAVFANNKTSVTRFRDAFGEDGVAALVTAADNLVEGRIDLLGLKGVFIGKEVDWHFEPIASKRAPLKHWKQFDELDTSETGNKKIIWELNRHQHFFTLGAAYWLTGDESYARTFAAHLRSWIETNPPGMGINWASSLEVAYRAMSWLWAFHFFENSEHLIPALFKKAAKVLYLHGRHIEKYLSTYYSPNTHLTGEALGLYYLGTQLRFLERAKHWRQLGEGILKAEVTRQIHPDGVYFEQSTWYQRYTVDIFSHFLVLKQLNGEDVYGGESAELEKRLQKAFEFLMHLTLPDGRTPLIGDDDGGRMLPLTGSEPDDFRGTLSVGAVLFDRPEFKYASGGASQEIFWLKGPDGLDKFEGLSSEEPAVASISFPEGGYYLMRDGWSDTDNFLVVDCGEIGAMTGGHGHSDTLSIEVAVHGKTLLVDSGTFTYHDPGGLRDYFRSTSAHNTLTIDDRSASEPKAPFSWKSTANADAGAWLSNKRFDFFKGSHDGYERFGDGAKHTRSILFVKGDYWVMRDHVEGNGSHEYALNFHYAVDTDPKVDGGGMSVSDEHHRLFVFGDNGSWQHNESWISNNHAHRANSPHLRFVSQGEGPQEFFSFILPVDAGVGRPSVEEVHTVSGRAFLIKYGEYTDLFIYNEDPTRPFDNGVFLSNFEYSWARVCTDERVPDQFILVNGDRFVIGGKEVFESHEVNSASARRLGNELYIETDLGRTIKTL